MGEYAIYGAEGELDLGNVEAVAGEGKLEVRSEPIPDDWADRWRTSTSRRPSPAGGS